MTINEYPDKTAVGRAAAEAGAAALREAIRLTGKARVIHSTGKSQFEFLEEFTVMPDIDWERMEMFHLDEYVGLRADHPGSFRKYLVERLISKTGIRNYHLIDGDAAPAEVIATVGSALNAAPVDIAFVGIGENGHLAFNDPPADFETEEPFILVRLNEACRRQQVGEGWFAALDEVPKRAITMSVRQILKAKKILCIVPEARKAAAVRACLTGPISPLAPASILRTHPDVTVFLDEESAAMLPRELRNSVTPVEV
jgi:glucosamine-6-phosphate deaminase